VLHQQQFHRTLGLRPAGGRRRAVEPKQQRGEKAGVHAE
jgi:hypothetical protein